MARRRNPAASQAGRTCSNAEWFNSIHAPPNQTEKTMKKFLKDALEIVGGILTLILFVVLFWLFLSATPDQYSAECEALREEMQQKGLIK